MWSSIVTENKLKLCLLIFYYYYLFLIFIFYFLIISNCQNDHAAYVVILHCPVGSSVYFLVESVMSVFLVFCFVLLYVFSFWVPCCYVRYDFCIETVFGSSLPPVVCRRVSVLFTLFVFVWFVCTSSCL